jgi:uncharacterized membrane protein YpjA
LNMLTLADEFSAGIHTITTIISTLRRVVVERRLVITITITNILRNIYGTVWVVELAFGSNKASFLTGESHTAKSPHFILHILNKI